MADSLPMAITIPFMVRVVTFFMASAPPTAVRYFPMDDIIGKYLTAVGGADAMKKVTTRTMKGIVMAMGSESAIDLYTKAPNKRVSISHSSPTSDSYTAFDGTIG